MVLTTQSKNNEHETTGVRDCGVKLMVNKKLRVTMLEGEEEG